MPQVGRALRSQLEAIMPTALDSLATFARDRLTVAAQKNLKGFAQREYIKGLNAPDSIEIKEASAIVRLVGDFPSAVENGASSYDIKQAMLAKATKRTKDGKPYVDVPFRHGTEEDATSLQGMPPTVASSMKASVRSAQKALRASGMKESDVRLQPTRGRGKSAPRTITKTLFPSGASLTVKHKSGIYDQMLRVPKLYGGAVQSTYITMRRISANSDPSSWIHPGLKPAKLFDSVIDEVQKTAPKLVSDMISRIGL